MDSLLDIRDLRVRYGSLEALRGIQLAARNGERVVVLGPNGAGKSTLLNTIQGVIRPAQGSITYAGEQIQRLGLRGRMRRGVVLVPEGRQILGNLTVDRNLALGGSAHRALCGRTKNLEYDEIWRIFPTLQSHLHQLAGSLSGGEQQMTAIGRALVGKPRLLLIDEPSLGLSPASTKSVAAALKEISARGVTMLISEQNLGVGLDLATRVIVLNRGAVKYDAPCDGAPEMRNIVRGFMQ